MHPVLFHATHGYQGHLVLITLEQMKYDCVIVRERKCREERNESPELQTTKLQRHPITDFTGMILHVITTYLSS